MDNDNLQFERNYWFDCCNTFAEDEKHYVYSKLMGIKTSSVNHYYFDVDDKNILDIGGGPTSMLLKCANLGRGKIYDPINYPQWTVARYNSKNIEVVVSGGEAAISESGWDEVWIYNCLQHVEDPALIIQNAMKSAKVLRIFEWIDIPPHDGHPHMLTKFFLESVIGQPGAVAELSERGCYGRCFFGEFKL